MEKKISLNLFIGTPAYSSLVHTDHEHSIISYYQRGLPITLMTLGNESLISRGRNTIISYFNYDKKFTHLLFLDADIYFHADDLIRLVAHEKDVIAAPVKLKGFSRADGTPMYSIGKILENKGDGLITTDKVATGVFMLSRKAVDALIQHAKENGDLYTGNPNSRGDSKIEIQQYDIFKTGVFNGEYLSEDYYVCSTLRSLGFDVFVDTNAKTKHNGMFVF